jgi:hypothetical protein
VSHTSENVFMSVTLQRMYLCESDFRECVYVSQTSENVSLRKSDLRKCVYGCNMS